MDIFRGDGAAVLQRTFTEYEGSKYLVDVFEASDGNLRVLKDRNFVQPFFSPEFANYPAEVIQPEHYWVTPAAATLAWPSTPPRSTRPTRRRPTTTCSTPSGRAR